MNMLIDTFLDKTTGTNLISLRIQFLYDLFCFFPGIWVVCFFQSKSTPLSEKNSIARLESGNYNPSLRFLQKIADVCDKKIEIRFIPKTC